MMIDPVAFHLGPLAVHWYGLMYLLGFFSAWVLLSWRASRDPFWQKKQVDDLIFFGAMGVIIGGRVGYVLLYDFSDFVHAPWIIVKVWEGGMSFHGGLIGVIIAMWRYGKKIGKDLFEMTDFIAPVTPIGLGAGRIGNLINGELWGKVTTISWGVVYEDAGPLPRHPSELYEFLLEGVVLFLVLWCYSEKPRRKKNVSALFLVLYGSFRFVCEFFRQPDPQWGYLAFGWLTMGQVLCVPMLLVGVWLWLTSDSNVHS